MDTKKKIVSYRDLTVWEMGMALAIDVDQLTNVFPEHEKFGL